MKSRKLLVVISVVAVMLNSLAIAGATISKQTDTTSPTLVIRAPSTDETFTKSPITVSGKATDDGTGNSGILSVTVNGLRASNDTTAGTGIANWSLSFTLRPGSNTLTVIAKDASPNQNATTQTVTVAFQSPVDNTPPLLDITSLEDDDTVTQSTLTVSGKATDDGAGDNGISSVTVNGVRAGNDTATGAGIANWSRTLTLNPGANTITVVAKDASANQNATTQTLNITFLSPLASVSAASYSSVELAAESIVAAFGGGLATTAVAANTTPLPTVLAGTTVIIEDSNDTERPAALFFVSPAQINYQIPPGTTTGTATVRVARSGAVVSSGTMQIETVAPGLFTADASGHGLPAAVALRVKADGTQSFEPVARFDPTQNRFAAVPLELGAATDQVFLLLFGTGIRFNSSLTAVTSRIGGVNAEVTFAGAQGSLVGLDQINLRLPRNLAGRGEVEIVLTVDGQPANTVRVNIK